MVIDNMKILAIIPARGGSKGVPRKNIRPLMGKPLIGWMIETAKASRVTRIIVSTDDEEIAEVAKSFGAEVPFLRPKEISKDLSTDVEFLTHVLTELEKKEGYKPDVVLRLPPTSPLCKSEHINKGIEVLLGDGSLDAVRPVCEAAKHPYKFWKIDSSGKLLEPFLPESFTGFKEPHNLPRQLFPKVYMHTGAMDVMRPGTILEKKSTSGDRLGFFLMEPEYSVNIDSETDFKYAEFLLSQSEAKKD